MKTTQMNCPNCKRTGTLLEILWGMPAHPVDTTKYKIGGCLIPEIPAELSCQNCSWEGSIHLHEESDSEST